MPVGDENVTVLRHHNIGGLIEPVVGTNAAQRHQHLAFRAEFKNLVAFAVMPQGVRHPEVSRAIHTGAVRENKQPAAPASNQFPRAVKLQNRRLRTPQA